MGTYLRLIGLGHVSGRGKPSKARVLQGTCDWEVRGGGCATSAVWGTAAGTGRLGAAPIARREGAPTPCVSARVSGKQGAQRSGSSPGLRTQGAQDGWSPPLQRSGEGKHRGVRLGSGVLGRLGVSRWGYWGCLALGSECAQPGEHSQRLLAQSEAVASGLLSDQEAPPSPGDPPRKGQSCGVPHYSLCQAGTASPSSLNTFLWDALISGCCGGVEKRLDLSEGRETPPGRLIPGM